MPDERDPGEERGHRDRLARASGGGAADGGDEGAPEREQRARGDVGRRGAEGVEESSEGRPRDLRGLTRGDQPRHGGGDEWARHHTGDERRRGGVAEGLRGAEERREGEEAGPALPAVERADSERRGGGGLDALA